MDVKRSSHGPGLDQRALLVQRGSDIGPHEAVEPGRELQLGRRLHLRLHAAQCAGDLDEPVAAGALAQRRTLQAPCANLLPADLPRGRNSRTAYGRVLDGGDPRELFE